MKVSTLGLLFTWHRLPSPASGHDGADLSGLGPGVEVLRVSTVWEMVRAE